MRPGVNRARIVHALFGCAALLGCGALFGCSEPTALLVFVDSDMPLERVVVEVTGTDGRAATDSQTLDFTNGPRPVRLTLVPESTHRVEDMTDVEIEVKGYLPGATDASVERTATTRFVSGQQLYLEMYLFQVCEGVSCPDGQSCVATAESLAGECDEEAIMGRRYDGDPPAIGETNAPDSGVPTCDASCWHVCEPDGGACETPTDLALGGAHSCALTAQGNVYCWGDDRDGQLGHSSGGLRPARVRMLPGRVTSVGAGESHTCALTETGRALCWGRNMEAQLGRELIETLGSAVPIEPGGIGPTDRVEQIGVGRWQNCARVQPAAGPREVRCWGLNAQGAAGGTPPGRLVPSAVTVADVNDALVVQSGHEHSCAMVDEGADNQVVCWGSTELGRLGNGEITVGSELTGQPVQGAGAGPLSGVLQLAVGDRNTCALLSGGRVRCWGPNEDRELGTDNGDSTPPFLYDATARSFPSRTGGTEITGWTSVAMGFRQGCGILESTAWCWGWTNEGRLGVPGAGEHTPPAPVTDVGQGVASVVALGGGRNPDDLSLEVTHACAILGGRIWCWGDNAHGQLGLGAGAPGSRVTPTRLGAQ